ncbi:MAG: hypothetical protein HYV27_14550 [Candidatus Hydrogenedentes bacterium]|nr:hypothetical protein [Candidatus Hydrogenedentota bacterium]
MKSALCALLIVLAAGLPLPAPAQTPDPVFTDATLDGSYFAHDLFARRDGLLVQSRGFRTYSGNGLLTRLFTYPFSTPMDYEVRDDGRFRLFTSTFDGTYNGIIGLDGAITAYFITRAPQSDSQIPPGYGSIQVSVLQGSGYADNDFVGPYSYHALLFTEDNDWRNEFAVVEANGTGRFNLIRQAGVLPFSYDVDRGGQVEIGAQESGAASIAADGDFLVHNVERSETADPFIDVDHEGIAFYLRRKNNRTLADMVGAWQIGEFRVSGNALTTTPIGSLTVGANGRVFGEMNGTSVQDTLSVTNLGTFTLAGKAGARGTFTADGDVAVFSPESATLVDGVGGVWMQVWFRTAGGDPTEVDSDGDGLTDEEEEELGTDPDDADTDNDGLLDGADPQPLMAGNVFTATLNRNQVMWIPGDPAPEPVILTLDSNDFPLFAWSLSEDAPWLTADKLTGTTDTTIALTINPAGLTVGNSPYTATITMAAPAMKPVAALTLRVDVLPEPLNVSVTPDTLDFITVQGATTPLTASVALSATEMSTFPWSVTEESTWLSVSPATGTRAQDVTVTINPTGLNAHPQPYTAEAQFIAGEFDQGMAQLDVSLTVLPPRDVGTPFVLQQGALPQSEPALAFDVVTGRYTVAWVEGDQVRAGVWTSDGIPELAPVQLSLAAQGICSHPSVAVHALVSDALIVWSQRTDNDADAQVYFRRIDLESLELSALRAASTVAGSQEAPHAVYNRNDNEFGIAFLLEIDDLVRPWFVLLDGGNFAQKEEVQIEALSGAITGVTASYATGENRYLLAWNDLEPVEEGETAVEKRIYVQTVEGDTGETPLAPRALEAPTGNHEAPRSLYNAATASWQVYYRVYASEVSAGATGAMLSVPLALNADTVLQSRQVTEVEMTRTGHAFALSPAASQIIALWTNSTEATPGLLLRRVTGSGLSLGSVDEFPGNTASQRNPAAVHNGNDGEFLVVWEDRSTTPAAIKAVRLDEGSDDVDEDGLPNEWEILYGLNPFSADGDDGALGDPDQDGLSNAAEFALGTNPIEGDTDGDGLRDGQEDRDGDGVRDATETDTLIGDTDGDGASDSAEWYLASDPLNGDSLPATGIFQVVHERFVAGETAEVTVHVYVATAGTYTMGVNETLTPQTPAAWSLALAEGEVAEAAWTPGVHAVRYDAAPAEGLPAEAAYAVYAFTLREAENVLATRTEIFLADPLAAPGVDTGYESQVAAHAPVIKLHRSEAWTPLAVPEALELAHLRLGSAGMRMAPNLAIDLAGATSLETAIDYPGEDLGAIAAPEESPVLYYTVAALPPAEGPGNPPAYAVQYYLYFPADDWNREQAGAPRHEGDWEFCQILFDAAWAPLSLQTTDSWRMALYDRGDVGGASRAWAAVERIDATHPVLYVGSASHSLHGRAGSTRSAAGLDVHDGLGKWLLPEAEEGVLAGLPEVYPQTLVYALQPLGRAGAAQAPWLNYAGQWGQPDFPQAAGVAPLPGLEDGPMGPPFLGMLVRGDAVEDAVRPWAQPLAWANALPADAPAAPGLVTALLPIELAGSIALFINAQGAVLRVPVHDLNGSLEATLPAGDYVLAFVSAAESRSDTLLALTRFGGVGASTLLLPVRPGITTRIGVATLNGMFLDSDNPYEDTDTDGDGVADAMDGDADGDGRMNGEDDDMLGDGWSDTYQAQDGDGDGIAAYFDLDDDGDEIPDTTDPDANGNGTLDSAEPGDLDGDGFPDAIDTDQDNDGYANLIEADAGTDPRHFFDTPARRLLDVDEDGDVDIGDAQQIVNQALGRAPVDSRADSDGNGRINAVDVEAAIRRILDTVL